MFDLPTNSWCDLLDIGQPRGGVPRISWLSVGGSNAILDTVYWQCHHRYIRVSVTDTRTQEFTRTFNIIALILF